MSRYIQMRFKNGAVAKISDSSSPNTEEAEKQLQKHHPEGQIWLYDVGDKEYYRREMRSSGKGTWNEKKESEVPELIKQYIKLTVE